MSEKKLFPPLTNCYLKSLSNKCKKIKSYKGITSLKSKGHVNSMSTYITAKSDIFIDR